MRVTHRKVKTLYILQYYVAGVGWKDEGYLSQTLMIKWTFNRINHAVRHLNSERRRCAYYVPEVLHRLVKRTDEVLDY